MALMRGLLSSRLARIDDLFNPAGPPAPSLAPGPARPTARPAPALKEAMDYPWQAASTRPQARLCFVVMVVPASSVLSVQLIALPTQSTRSSRSSRAVGPGPDDRANPPRTPPGDPAARRARPGSGGARRPRGQAPGPGRSGPAGRGRDTRRGGAVRRRRSSSDDRRTASAPPPPRPPPASHRPGACSAPPFAGIPRRRRRRGAGPRRGLAGQRGGEPGEGGRGGRRPRGLGGRGGRGAVGLQWGAVGVRRGGAEGLVDGAAEPVVCADQARERARAGLGQVQAVHQSPPLLPRPRRLGCVRRLRGPVGGPATRGRGPA